MTGSRLKAQCLNIPEKTVLVTCHQDGNLIGHAFATVWDYNTSIIISTILQCCIHIAIGLT